PAAIWTSPDGVVLTVSAAGVIRTCLPGDSGCENGLCRLSDVNPRARVDALLGTGAGAALRPLVVADRAELLAPTSAGCPFRAQECPNDGLRVWRTVFTGDAFAVSNGHILTLHGANVARVFSLPDSTKDQPVAPGSTTARFLLAASSTHAFFIDGRK